MATQEITAGNLGILQLRKFKETFKTEAGYFALVSALHTAADPNTMSVVLDDEEVVCSVISPNEAQEALRGRIVARMMEDPQQLKLIAELLEDPKMVEYGTFE